MRKREKKRKEKKMIQNQAVNRSEMKRYEIYLCYVFNHNVYRKYKEKKEKKKKTNRKQYKKMKEKNETFFDVHNQKFNENYSVQCVYGLMSVQNICGMH